MMIKLFYEKTKYRILILIISTVTLVVMALVLLLPFDFKPKESNDKIKAEIMSRIENVAKQRDKIGFISFTPFMWDEGYYIDHTVDEQQLRSMTNNGVKHEELSDDEQRLIFFYKGQLIVELNILKDEVDFDIPAGKIEDEWLSIRKDSDGAVILYK